MSQLSQSKVVAMDLTRLTRENLLNLCWDLELDFNDDMPASKLREVILESNSDNEEIEHFGNMYLLDQEEEVQRAQRKERWRQEELEAERRHEEHITRMQELDEEIERLNCELVALQQSGQSVDVAHERCDVAAVPFKTEAKATGQTSVDEVHERCDVAAVPIKAEERATGQKFADVPHERCVSAAVPFRAEESAAGLISVDIAAVPFEAKEKASACKGMEQVLTHSEGKELAVTAGCEGSVVGETKLRLTECSIEPCSPVDHVDERQRRTKGSRFGTKECAKRRKRPKNRSAARLAISAARLTRTFKRRGGFARKGPLSSLTGLNRRRLSGRRVRNRSAQSTRPRSYDELIGNHQDWAREMAEEHIGDEERQSRTKGSQVRTKKRAQGRKRPKGNNKAKLEMSTTRLSKGFKRRGKIARKVPLSSLTGLYRVRPNRRKRKAHRTRQCLKDRLLGNYPDSPREKSDEHVGAGEHQRWAKGSVDGTKRRAKRRKRRKNRQAKIATRLRNVFKWRSEISRKLPYRKRPSGQRTKKREAHGVRKWSKGKRPFRCSRGALDGVRGKRVGGFRGAGSDSKSASRNVAGFGSRAIDACCRPRFSRKSFRARPPRVRLRVVANSC